LFHLPKKVQWSGKEDEIFKRTTTTWTIFFCFQGHALLRQSTENIGVHI
jgi:hypothetical protein